MNKRLILLQKGIKGISVIVLDDEYKNLAPIISIKANVSDKFLLGATYPPYAQKLSEKCAKNDVCFFVIKGIDEASEKEQKRFLSIIKDREQNFYRLPDNCIVVLTVKSTETLKNIIPEIYKLAVVCI